MASLSLSHFLSQRMKKLPTADNKVHKAKVRQFNTGTMPPILSNKVVAVVFSVGASIGAAALKLGKDFYVKHHQQRETSQDSSQA